jgi:flagellar hook-basal body complex protein FliE
MADPMTSLVAGGVQRAYQAAKAIPASPAAPVPAPEGGSFADMLTRTAAETIGTVRQGDQAAVAGLAGAMPMQQVVEATMAMESAVQVTVAIRDRMVEAYQEIMRMAV